MRAKFDQQLQQLNQALIAMGALCEEAIALAARAILDADPALAQGVRPLEEEVDRKEREIETLCMRMLLQQQPVAQDLRQISAALKMISDFERIGDQAADIAELIPYLCHHQGQETNLIGHMAREVIRMVTESAEAFAQKDTVLAQAVISRDDIVDDLFNKIKASLIGVIAEKPKDGEYAIDLLMAAKYLERIGDHAVNIAEWVLYSVTGIHKWETGN